MTRLQEAQWIEQVAERAKSPQPAEERFIPARLDILHIDWLRALLQNRWPQFIVRLLALSGFVFTLITAIFGTRVGSHNFAIIMVWIAWWTSLKLGFIPLGGRSWCSVCPIALPGEWLQQGGILEKRGKKVGLSLRWPKRLRGSWLQSGAFLLIGLFSAVTLTDPRVTGWVLLAIFGLAIGMSLVFEQRAFCSYLCPIGGFSGLYAQAAPLELQVVDAEVCRQHGEKTCYQACPWGLYPLALKDSSACGLCLECVRACPKDNLALNLRPYGSDLTKPSSSSRLDDTFLALVMLSSALVFSAVFLGPWGWLKTAAFHIGSSSWLAYSAGFLALSLLIMPAAFTGCVWLWKKLNQSNLSLKRLIAGYSHSLLPLGLLAWIAFTISFALPKLRLILGVLNDPFGWGWNWLNVTNASQTIDVSAFSPYLQVILLILGAFWSARVSQKIFQSYGKVNTRLNVPLLAFYLLYTGLMLWLLVG